MGKSRRRTTSGLVVAVGAAAALALGGCDIKSYDSAYQDLAPEDAGGAKLVLVDAKPVYVAGQNIGVDVTGSGFAKAPDICPNRAYFFTDDEPGDDEHRFDMESLQGSGGCVLAQGRTFLYAPAGVPGTVRDQEISVRVEGWNAQNADEMHFSAASITVKIATPNADGSIPAAANPAPAPAPTTTTTATTPTPPPSSSSFPDTPVHCDSSPVAPTGFTWGFDGPNPGYGIVGEQAEIDPSATTDTGGPISWFLWDVDGDGKADAGVKPGEGLLKAAPTTAGQSKGCLVALDGAGAIRASHPLTFWYVYAAPKLGAAPLTADASPVVNQAVTFTPKAIPSGADQICVIYDQSIPPGDPGNRECKAPGSTFTHTYTAAGRVYVETDYQKTTAPSDYNYWSQSFVVSATRSARALRSSGATSAASKKSAAVRVTAPLKVKGSVVSPGKVSITGGNLATTNAIVRGRVTSTIARSKVPKPLRFLLSATYAGKFSGKRVLVSTTDSGIAGTGRMLARASKDKKTLVCIRVTTDGLTTAGTKWTVVGATGRAAGWSGSGTATPLIFGPGASKAQTASLVLQKGKKRGIGACQDLRRVLDPAKKKTKKKKRG